MKSCVSRFLLPIILVYIGFILLGLLGGLIVGLIVTAALLPALIIGFLIGLALAIIANAIVLIIINKICYKNTMTYSC